MKKSKRLLVSLLVTACMVLAALPVNAASEDVIYGKVTAVNGNDVTIAIGTLNQNSETTGGTPGAMPEMLTLTGESITFTLTDEMAITKASPGQPPETGTSTATASASGSSDATAADIVVGAVLKITYTTGTDTIAAIEIMSASGAPGSAPGGGSATVSTGAGAYVLTNGETLTGGTYTSTNDDENAVRAEGAITATMNGVTVAKTGGTASSSDASSFYGLNAAILALDNAILNITGGSVTASTEGSNGVFAYNGATINIADTTINVTGGNAGGIEVAGGGNLYASNLTVNSTVKAAIRSDRGGGTMVVNGGTYTTSGSTGAPAIYSTADITVTDATLTAETSEAIVVEGLNSVTLSNCTVSGNMTGSNGGSTADNIHNVMLYQSMSGDAQVGNSSFTMTDGALTSNSGDMFYVTNTESVIALNNVALTLADDSDTLLNVAGNDGSRGWGTAGSNGGKCTFTASNQTLTGNITVDAISTLDLAIKDNSSFTGAINSDKTTAAALKVTLEKGSSWKLTGDSYITEFDGDASGLDTNGYTLYVNGVAFDGTSTTTGKVVYATHVQNVGWQNTVADGAVSGTVGQGLRLEGITIETGIDGLGIEYATHVQNLGWQGYVADGVVAGTEGQSLRLEAIKIQLTGEQAQNYDVYYRVQVENLGWLGWASNGAEAGTAGYGYRLEGIQIQLVEKGAAFDTGGDAFYEAGV